MKFNLSFELQYSSFGDLQGFILAVNSDNDEIDHESELFCWTLPEAFASNEADIFFEKDNETDNWKVVFVNDYVDYEGDCSFSITQEEKEQLHDLILLQKSFTFEKFTTDEIEGIKLVVKEKDKQLVA